MKKLLFLLFPVISYGQTFTQVGGTTNTINNSSYTVASISFASNKLYLLFTVSTSAGVPNIPTVSGTGITFTQIASTTFNTVGSAVQQVSVFRALISSGTSTTLTVSFSGQTQNELLCNIYEVSGVAVTGTNGSDAIVQSATDRADTDANPAITLSSLSGSGNAVICIFSNNQAPFGGTPESGWTQLLNLTAIGSPPSSYIVYRTKTTDNTPSVTASASNWGGVAIELLATGRRIIITN